MIGWSAEAGVAYKKPFGVWLLCISAAAVTADDASGVLGSDFHKHFPDGLARWKLCQVHKKLRGWTAASLRRVPWEGRMQPVKSWLPIPGGRHFEVQEQTMRSAPATDHRWHHRNAIPHPLHPLIPVKMTPTAPGNGAGMG